MNRQYYISISAFRATCFLLVLIAFGITTRAQDTHFSQFFETPILRNPGLSGIFDGDVRAQAVFRSQWASVTVPYTTGSLNAEYKFPAGKNNDFVTAGLAVMYDRAGTINFTTTNLMPALNYHKSLSGNKTKYLSLGFMAGLVQRNIDRTKITTNNQFDGNGYNPSLPDGELFSQTNYGYFDAAVGMSFNSSIGDNTGNYYAGIAFHHINTPQNSFYRNPLIETKSKWVISGGYKSNINENAALTILGDYSMQGDFSEAVFGAMYTYKPGGGTYKRSYFIHFGSFFRWNDAIIPIVKLDYMPFSFALSYDVNISTLNKASSGRGAFELSLTFIGFLDRENSSRNAVLCPRF